jgi:hypothetical protein
MSYVNSILGPFADLWAQEPVLVTAAVTAALDLLVAFGINIDQTQKNAVLAVVTALGAIIARGRVSPVKPPATPLVATVNQ